MMVGRLRTLAIAHITVVSCLKARKRSLKYSELRFKKSESDRRKVVSSHLFPPGIILLCSHTSFPLGLFYCVLTPLSPWDYFIVFSHLFPPGIILLCPHTSFPLGLFYCVLTPLSPWDYFIVFSQCLFPPRCINGYWPI